LRTAAVAIAPLSDIVLDVARAADPERYRAAAERLARLRATTAAAAVTAQTSAAPADPAAAANRSIDAGAPVQGPRRGLDAYGQFEAFVLQSFIQSMLPRNAANVYGSGTAGEVWRSMLAEQLGGELARSGQVGIARRLAASGPPPAQTSSDPAGRLALSPSLLSALSSIPPANAVPASTTPPASERS